MPLTPAADEEIVTIAELVADPSASGPVRAELRGIGGSIDRFFATASDGTGSATVFMMRDETENFREASGSGRYELWLVPLADGPRLDERAGGLRRLTDVFPVLYFGTRVIPL